MILIKKLCYGLLGLTLLSQSYAMDEGQQSNDQAQQHTQQLLQQPQLQKVLEDQPATTNRLPILLKLDIPVDDDVDAKISDLTTMKIQVDGTIVDKDGTIVGINDVNAMAE